MSEKAKCSDKNDERFCRNCDVRWTAPVDQCPKCGLRGWMLHASNVILDDSVDVRNRLQLVGALLRVNRDTSMVTPQMVDRFLSWSLPKDFSPDCGIRFTPVNHPNSWPVGTNLLTATQAQAMLEHVLSAPSHVRPTTERAQSDAGIPVELRGRQSQEGASTQAPHSQTGGRVEAPATSTADADMIATIDKLIRIGGANFPCFDEGDFMDAVRARFASSATQRTRFDLTPKQVEQLRNFSFGGQTEEDAMPVTIGYLEKHEDGPGWYVWGTEYPEEGSLPLVTFKATDGSNNAKEKS